MLKIFIILCVTCDNLGEQFAVVTTLLDRFCNLNSLIERKFVKFIYRNIPHGSENQFLLAKFLSRAQFNSRKISVL